MGEFATWLGWLTYAATWLPIAWLAMALVIGIPWIISDELRIKRTAPNPTEVSAYSDRMEAEHGIGALRAVGQAIYDTLERKDFASRRFLKAVSAELARRTIQRDGLQQIRHSWKNRTNP